MLLPMLKAIKNMIYVPISPETPQAVVRAKIECAGVILDEIISSLESSEKPVLKEQQLGEKPVLDKKATLDTRPTVVVEDAPLYMVTVDDNKGLRIVDAPLDLLLEVDGQKVSYGEAMGKLFKKVRIL